MQDLFDKNNLAFEEYDADRRGFLKRGLFLTAALGFWNPALAMAASQSGREISFHNAHTGENFKGEYWQDGKYLPDAFNEIRKIMRDFRTGDQCAIDPRLIDVLFVVREKAGNNTPFSLFSGYRSPKTNKMLRRKTEGVARGSLHMQGQAADINLPGISLVNVEKTALALRMGGVGYYPKSGFVHIDNFRDIPQNQRFHGFFTLLEEVDLAFHYAHRHFK